MAKTSLQTSGWARQSDGSWEGTINGTTYFIVKEKDKYCIYRQMGYEQVDLTSDLMTAIQLASKMAVTDYA